VSGWKQFRHLLEVALCRSIAWGIPRLSRVACMRLGHALGEIAFFFDRRGRAVGIGNVECAFGARFSPGERRELVRSSYRNFARTMMDLFWSVRLTPENYAQWVHLEGLEPLQARLASDRKGAIFLCVHQGNWEWASLLGGFTGHKVAVVAAKFKNPGLAGIFQQLREHTGQEMIAQENSLLRMLKIVKRNGLTGMLVDLNLRPSQAATVIDSFGPDALKMCVPLLHAVLAQRVGTPLIPIETEPLPDGSCRVIVHPPVEFPEGATLQEICQACWDVFEKLIRARPGQWLWPYKHFRYRPKGATRAYPAYSNESGKFEKLMREQQAGRAASQTERKP
jgi:KDO2-lipid IV(A) lauroyltransferase